MWVVMHNIGVCENVQRRQLVLQNEQKQKPTIRNPGNFDFQKSKDDKKKNTKTNKTTTTKRKANLRSRGKNGYPVKTDRN